MARSLDLFRDRKPCLLGVGLTAVLGLYLVFFVDRPSSLVVWTTPGRPTSMLPHGTAAPVFTLPTVQGEPVSLAAFTGQRVGLAFVTAGCPFCRKLLAQLATWRPAEEKSLLIICRGNGAEAQRIEAAYALRFPVLVDSLGAVHQAYAIESLPRVYLVDQAGKIDKGTTGWPVSWEMIQKEL